MENSRKRKDEVMIQVSSPNTVTSLKTLVKLLKSETSSARLVLVHDIRYNWEIQ